LINPEKVRRLRHFIPCILPLNHMEESTKPFFDSSLLRGLSLSLHLTLVALHVLLIAIWATRLEHQLVFPIDTEKNRIISLVISMISTSFVTVRVSVRRDSSEGNHSGRRYMRRCWCS
jgi:hypothetical protein